MRKRGKRRHGINVPAFLGSQTIKFSVHETHQCFLACRAVQPPLLPLQPCLNIVSYPPLKYVGMVPPDDLSEHSRETHDMASTYYDIDGAGLAV